MNTDAAARADSGESTRSRVAADGGTRGPRVTHRDTAVDVSNAAATSIHAVDVARDYTTTSETHHKASMDRPENLLANTRPGSLSKGHQQRANPATETGSNLHNTNADVYVADVATDFKNRQIMRRTVELDNGEETHAHSSLRQY